ncbi:MAG: hypothetical protein MUF25_00715 [Pirellulaceae bacterium]|jgi:hypothetical protein|nr:hypothetical protein [Pirellulaceae bacterium]
MDCAKPKAERGAILRNPSSAFLSDEQTLSDIRDSPLMRIKQLEQR